MPRFLLNLALAACCLAAAACAPPDAVTTQAPVAPQVRAVDNDQAAVELEAIAIQAPEPNWHAMYLADHCANCPECCVVDADAQGEVAVDRPTAPAVLTPAVARFGLPPDPPQLRRQADQVRLIIGNWQASAKPTSTVTKPWRLALALSPVLLC